jgi:hypothetical protein
MNSQFDWPKILICIGLTIAFLGFLFTYVDINLSWFGRLPGDIRIEKQNFKFFFPITSMIIISIIINLAIYLIRLFL